MSLNCCNQNSLLNIVDFCFLCDSRQYKQMNLKIGTDVSTIETSDRMQHVARAAVGCEDVP